MSLYVDKLSVNNDLHYSVFMTNNKLQIEYFPPESLKPNPWNSNRVGPEMEARLEASIKEFGFIKPIITRELSDGSLQILGGEHRARKAAEMEISAVPVVVLHNVDDKRAKALGLADNGHYGEDDALKLAEILKDLGDDYLDAIPFDANDLAGIFSAADVDLDSLGFDANDDMGADLSLADVAARPTPTHELMRFKVPVEDRERVEKFIAFVVKSKGLSGESDSMIAAGMALVEIVNAAKEVM